MAKVRIKLTQPELALILELREANANRNGELYGYQMAISNAQGDSRAFLSEEYKRVDGRKYSVSLKSLDKSP